MAKEIRVYKYAEENGSYNELWKVVGEEKYYVRATESRWCSWYSVCDPLGYCERNEYMPEDVMFVLCDEEGNEYMRYSNGMDNPLPKFEDFVKEKWQFIKANVQHNTENLTANFWAEWYNGDTTMKINQWLISYMDSDLYGKEIEEMHGYPENWTGCWHEHEINYEPIPNSEFMYLGHKYQFTKVTHKHDICGVIWYEFVCTDSPYVIDNVGHEDRSWINSYMYMGNWFDDSTHGTMYDQRTAREMVISVLKDAIPKEKDYSQLLYIVLGDRTQKWWSDVCHEATYSEVADWLINRDYHRTHVDDLCEHIEQHIKGKVYASNRKNKELIREQYPDIYAYNMCLI